MKGLVTYPEPGLNTSRRVPGEIIPKDKRSVPGGAGTPGSRARMRIVRLRIVVGSDSPVGTRGTSMSSSGPQPVVPEKWLTADERK